MTSLVSKLLGPPEEVDLCARFQGHVHRWMIVGNQRFKVYLHHSSSEDLAADFLLYPQKLISIGFVNSYNDNADGARDACANRATWMLLIAKPSHSHGESRSLESPSLGWPSTFAKR